jgi:hypothetical protein
VVVCSPLRPHELAFLIDIGLEVVSESIQSVYEVLLECVQRLMHEVHLLHSVLFVRRDIPILQLVRSVSLSPYEYVFAKRCSSFRFDSIRAFFMSSKSWDMSFIWFFSCCKFSFSRRFYSIIFEQVKLNGL